MKQIICLLVAAFLLQSCAMITHTTKVREKTKDVICKDERKYKNKKNVKTYDYDANILQRNKQKTY